MRLLANAQRVQFRLEGAAVDDFGCCKFVFQ
jgi:hypothetical protein